MTLNTGNYRFLFWLGINRQKRHKFKPCTIALIHSKVYILYFLATFHKKITFPEDIQEEQITILEIKVAEHK